MPTRARDAFARLPLTGAVARAYRRRPFLTAWVFLATGMVLAVLVFGREVGLTSGQHAALAVLCLPLAWLCTWIIFLEGGENGEGGPRGAG